MRVRANHLRLPVDQVAVCSTASAVHGQDQAGHRRRCRAAGGGDAKAADHFATAIRTTDKHAKKGAVPVTLPRRVQLGFAAKGCGMISPDMATMLCFVTCGRCR